MHLMLSGKNDSMKTLNEERKNTDQNLPLSAWLDAGSSLAMMLGMPTMQGSRGIPQVRRFDK